MRLHDHLRTIVHRDDRDYPPWGSNDRENAPDGWYSDCSCGCKWAAWLEDEPSDWLVCTNPKSHRCGLLTFEHQGCPEFEYDETEDEDEA